jgi:N-acetylglucosaminyldiphosphoundecaprenol N-acetyl-beta-D-mannosaminyltransferase
MGLNTEVKAFNVTFNCLTKKDLFSLLMTDRLRMIATVNAEFIVLANEDERFKRILDSAVTTIDGQIPYFFLKLRNRNILFEKLSGSDLIYDLCAKAQNLELRVFLLGGLPQSNKLALDRLKMLYPQLEIEGYSPPFFPYPFPNSTNKEIFNRLESFRPDILFVAFGAPKQEFWIYDNFSTLENLGIRLAMGVGGAFELVGGVEKRAPRFIQKIGFEGVWRLLQNPKRWKRFIRNFKFFKYALL